MCEEVGLKLEEEFEQSDATQEPLAMDGKKHNCFKNP
jgi:hypothetical protein